MASSPVSIACTPGCSRAAFTRSATMRACARSDRRKYPCNCAGIFQSEAYLPLPVTSRKSSSRDTRTPSTSKNCDFMVFFFTFTSGQLRHADHHLAEMLSARQVLVGGARFREIEHAVDQRLEPGDFDRPIHRLEHVAAADLDAAHRRTLGKKSAGIDGRFAGEIADHADVAAVPDGGNRAGDRSGASDLYHEIRAAPAGEFAYAHVPVRRRAVVDHVARAKLAQPPDLVIAASGGNDAR